MGAMLRDAGRQTRVDGWLKTFELRHVMVEGRKKALKCKIGNVQIKGDFENIYQPWCLRRPPDFFFCPSLFLTPPSIPSRQN
jgi:hypothetical protein